MADDDTKTLRALWTHGAAKAVGAIRNGKQIDLETVERLQKSLEGIEAREELNELNDIARGVEKGDDDV